MLQGGPLLLFHRRLLKERQKVIVLADDPDKSGTKMLLDKLQKVAADRKANIVHMALVNDIPVSEHHDLKVANLFHGIAEDIRFFNNQVVRW